MFKTHSIIFSILAFLSTVSLQAQESELIKSVSADSSYFLQYPSLYFGLLCPGQTIEQTFTIQNISSQPITVAEIKTLSPFTIISPATPLLLQPNQLEQIRISFAPPGKGNFSAPFIIRLSNRPTGDTLTLHGDGKDNSIQISTLNIDFGDLPVNRTAEQTFTITNSGSDTIQIGLVDILPSNAPYSVISPSFPVSLPKSASITVRVQFHPVLPGVSTPNAAIHIIQPCADTKLVALRGRGIRGDLTFGRTDITFGDAWCTTDTRLDSIRITNTGSDTISVFSASIGGTNKDDFGIISGASLPRKLQPNESILFIIEFHPQARGARTAILTITSADVNNPSKDITLNGIVRTATFAALPTTIDYGDVRIGSMLDLPTSINNPNPVATRIQSVKFIPPNPAITLLTSLPQTISPQDFVSLTIRFLPNNTNIFNSTMVVYFDSPCPDSIIVNLTGRGVQGEARFNWTALPPTLKCDNSDGNISIENTGTADYTIRTFFIEGKDASLFSIINQPTLPVSLSPGNKTTITIRFKPTSPPNGLKIAFLGMTLSGASVDTVRINISSERISPIIQTTSIDFGNVDLRVSSTQTFQLQNVETTPATLTFLDIQPSEFQYRGQNNFSFQPPSSVINLPVEFSPKTEQVFSGTVRFISQPCGDTIVVPITGRGLRCSVTSKFALQNINAASDTTIAQMGQKILIPLSVTQSFGDDNISLLTFTVSYNKTLLLPTNVTRGSLTPNDTIQFKVTAPGVLQIIISSSSTLKSGTGTLAVIEFLAVLGDNLETPITLTMNSLIQKCFTTTSTHDAYFILISPCVDRTGESLKLTAGNTLFQNKPNPFNPSTTIEYDLINDSFVDVSVYNIFGEKITALVHEMQQAKHHSIIFNGSLYPTGMYFYVLQTDNERLMKSMLYIK